MSELTNMQLFVRVVEARIPITLTQTSACWRYITAIKGCFGSLAAPFVNISLTAAFGWKADIKNAGNT